MTTAVRGTPAGDEPPDPARPLGPGRHEVVVHSSAGDLARLLAPRIREALDARDVVVAALEVEHALALRAELGDVAAAVEFTDPAQVHGVPAFTAAVRVARTSRRADRAGGRALVIGQHVRDLPGCGPEHWARFDIALNVAISGLRITVLCPYAEDDPDLPRARTTHPVITGAAGSVGSAAFRPPRDALVDYPPPPPPDLGPPAAELEFGVGELVALRHLVGRCAAGAGLSPDRAADLVLAVNELASNSVEHGPGTGRLRVWDNGDGSLTAEVGDHGGPLDVPFPGLALPPPEGARGRGLWLASELCDVLQVWSGDGDTVIRVHLT